MPFATFAALPLPFRSRTRTGRILALGAMPAMPRLLLYRAAMMPATWVPCPLSSLALVPGAT